MEELGSLGVYELMILSCVCLVPIVIAVGAVAALLVVVGRRKPKAERGAQVPQAPAPAAPRELAARPETSPEPEPAEKTRATAVSEPVVKSCTSCGADNPVDNAFCEYCGASLAEK
jgi:hypothetical protein